MHIIIIDCIMQSHMRRATATGGHAYIHDDWITTLPLDRLWASTESQTQDRTLRPGLIPLPLYLLPQRDTGWHWGELPWRKTCREPGPLPAAPVWSFLARWPPGLTACR